MVLVRVALLLVLSVACVTGQGVYPPLAKRLSPLAHAYGQVGFAPQAIVQGQQAGQGVVFLPLSTTLYSQPSTTSTVVDTWTWEPSQTSTTLFSAKSQTPFNANGRLLAFYPALGIAMLPVVQETGDGWAEVSLTADGSTTAWLRLRQAMTPEEVAANPAHAGVYQSWFNFMRLNARSHGIYWLAGTPAYHQALRTTPQDDAKLVPVTVMKSSRVLHARGNWLLVEAVDIGQQRPMGWVRWRSDEGDLLVFTSFNQQSNVVIPSGY
jgi:hypothetical protein